MKEPDFLVEISTNFPLQKPIIITHSDYEWDDDKKELIKVDKENIYYDIKKEDTK